jgi:hypothetical protein
MALWLVRDEALVFGDHEGRQGFELTVYERLTLRSNQPDDLEQHRRPSRRAEWQQRFRELARRCYRLAGGRYGLPTLLRRLRRHRRPGSPLLRLPQQ